jgi:Major Facilitator Superfamily
LIGSSDGQDLCCASRRANIAPPDHSERRRLDEFDRANRARLAHINHLLRYVGAGYSGTQAGATLLPIPIVIAGASPTLGALSARIGPRLPLTLGHIIVAGGLLLLLRVGISGSYWTAVFPALCVIAIGMSGAVAPLTTAVLSSVRADNTGAASGLNSAVSRLDGSIATALLGAVLGASGSLLIRGFRGAVIVGAIACVIAGLSAFALIGPKS